MGGSGVRELPSSIAYLTGLEFLQANFCENLTFNSQVSSSNSELQLLPKLVSFELATCNLSKIDLLLHLDCWSTLTRVHLSGNNFVNLPICFSKFVNLSDLGLSDCRSLLEIPEQVLPRGVRRVELENCTSLEKIPKLAWVLLDNCTSLEKIPESPRWHDLDISLVDCVRLRGYDITENIFRNQVSVCHPHSDFQIVLPGDEVPKWFSCRKDATIIRRYLKLKRYEYEKEEEEEEEEEEEKEEVYEAGCEVKFEIPPNLKRETLRLVLCASNAGSAKIFVNGELVRDADIGDLDRDDELLEGHVFLKSIPLLDRYKRHDEFEFEEPLTKQGNTCQVIFGFFVKVPAPDKIPCGVHLLGHQVSETDVVDHGPTQLSPDVMAVDDDAYDDQHQDCELLSLSLASKTSLGKRPRQSDYMALHDDHRANVVDNGDREAQWLTLFTGPADHQKRRHIDLNEEPKYVNPLNFE